MQTNLFLCIYAINKVHTYLSKPKMQDKKTCNQFAKCMFRHLGLDGVQQSMAQLSN